ncbi:inactive tyrosine-protein kinase transmembrane receptor ROR1 isoform X1 [Strongylocentrotus purpuratus]|uniref:Tyrosine-protein kinase receptor n=1 Tax=Strongylocentrotus purpuratus TaxID=7668 RepID=A0A7M7RGE2_STRPU|nr:inactive tyrosine-protein kinase transmembrane receptor ROR1 isoform X1 [Strongylocentrotus purpuratus]|eukprot:XP_792459.2 PREDICTED: tyrosine-protein kinase transmembrane receptor ROR1 isoform X2 [Strongylocentrotus purpuratus]
MEITGIYRWIIAHLLLVHTFYPHVLSDSTTPPPGTPYIAIDAPMNNETVIPGDSVTLNCRIRGYPKPTYWWYRNDAIIRDDIGRNVVREFKGGSTLTINNVGTLDTGSYKCIAANDNGTKSVQGSITLNANSPTYSESSVSDYLDEMSVDEPQCEPYRGSVCSPHIANSQVYIPAGQTQADIEAALGAAIQQINNDLPITLNQRCTKYLKPSMCLTAFPLCRERPRLAVHRMCYDECRLLTTEICSSLVDYVDAQPELGLVDMLPICTDLPLPGAVAGANSENSCLRMGMSESGVATITPFGVPTARYFIIMERPMNNETELHTGDKATLRCRIIGDPTPHYKWYKNDALLTEERRDRRITTKEYEWGSKLSIRNVDTTDTGYYKCVAENRAGVRSTMGILFARIASETTRPVAAIPSQGYCQPYRGMTCSNFISNHSIYVTDFQAQKLIDERLTQAFLLMARDLSPQCQQYAIPSLCFFAFPFCDETRQEPRGRELCRDECEILEQDICKTEYQIAKEMPNVILPDCSRLPAIGTNANANCIRVGLPDVAAVTDHKCYNDTGEDYRGRINTTKSGFACQSWDKQEPHEHALWPSHYRELAGGHNFCRNPGNGLDKPWCFTTNPDVRAEKCDIPRCDELTGSGVVSRPTILYIIVPAVTVIVVILLICGCVCFCWRQTKSQRYGGVASRTRPSEVVALQQKLQVKEIPLAAIKFSEALGDGTFGKVWRGELMGLNNQYSCTSIVIKTLDKEASPALQQDYRNETSVMASLNHPNIITLLGVCTKEKPNCMLFEFLPHGDLHEFLVRHSPNSDVGFGSGDDDTQSSLDASDFLNIAIQIVSGMDYLSSRHFVHRDLAARNCMVGEHHQIKITDFGLARDIYSGDYYRMPSQAVLPIRWMSPEAIMFGRFTVESDIWSFGVVLWEIYSYGLQPFYGYNNNEVIEMIRTRHILPSPSGCPQYIYALMTECWSEIPARRPPFKVISTRLRALDTVPMHTQNGNIYGNPAANFNPQYSGLYSPQTHCSSEGKKSHGSSGGSRHSQPKMGLADKAMSETSSSSHHTRSTGHGKSEKVEQTAV